MRIIISDTSALIDLRKAALLEALLRLEELRRQYTELQAEITRGEQAAGERQRSEQESAATAAAEARRRRATQDVQELTRDLDEATVRITEPSDTAEVEYVHWKSPAEPQVSWGFAAVAWWLENGTTSKMGLRSPQSLRSSGVA